MGGPIAIVSLSKRAPIKAFNNYIDLILILYYNFTIRVFYILLN